MKLPVSKGSIKRANNINTKEGHKNEAINPSNFINIKIDINSIIEKPSDWTTSIREENELLNLVSSIEKYGILEPLLIGNIEGNFIVLSGYLRLEALKSLSINEVSCNIIEISSLNQGKEIYEELHKHVKKGKAKDIISETKFKVISSFKNDLPDYLL